MSSSDTHKGDLRRKRHDGDSRSPNSAAAARSNEDVDMANERLAQMEIVRKKNRIQSVCAQPQEWSTKELRETAKSLNLPNTSNMSKKGLCELLAKHHDMRLEKEVQDEVVDYPAGFFDIVSQGPLYDPIIASDGYSYNRASLRILIKTSARENKKCLSLHNVGEVLQNPFPNIRGAPQTWPLIENKSLKLAVEEWMVAHGLEVTSEEKNEIEHTPSPSRRDDLVPDARGGMMANGIYFVPPPAQNAQMHDVNNTGTDETSDEDEEDEDTFVPTWFEEDIDNVVFSQRAIAQGIEPRAVHISGQSNINTGGNLKRNAGETTVEWIGRLLLMYGCVVVESISQKNILVNLHIPTSVVVLDKEAHKIRVFDKRGVEEDVPIRSHGLSSLVPVTYMLEAIWEFAWREPVPTERNSRVARHVAQKVMDFIRLHNQDVRQIPLFFEANIGLPIEEEEKMSNGVAYGYLPHGQFVRSAGHYGRR